MKNPSVILATTSLLTPERFSQIALWHAIRLVRRHEGEFTKQRLAKSADKIARLKQAFDLGVTEGDLVSFALGVIESNLDEAVPSRKKLGDIALILSVQSFRENGHVKKVTRRDIGASLCELQDLVPQSKSVTLDEACKFAALVVYKAVLVTTLERSS
ncbi:MAG: hypothetical protein HZA81_02805 [Candidatus Taylorbacteria bacterium]|nr:hypothetical protein [Candidatus Taylorbacteria bacterium]